MGKFDFAYLCGFRPLWLFPSFVEGVGWQWYTTEELQRWERKL